MDLDQTRAEMRRIVDALPQRCKIPDAVAERWISGVLDLDPERGIWHARRAGGIGGSEIGELLLAHFKEPSYLNEPESIWRSKMLLELPSKENIYTARGTFLEPLVQHLNAACTGSHSLIGDPDIQRAIRAGHPTNKFIVGNPDDVTEKPGVGLIVPDFKVRSDLDWNSKLNIVNISQVHWYGLILVANLNRPIAHYSLAELDIPNTLANSLMQQLRSTSISDEQKRTLIETMSRQIQQVNLPGFGVRITSFDRSEDLERDLVTVARKFWTENVLGGQPFQRPGKSLRSDVPQDVRERVELLFNDSLKFKLAERVAAEKAKETLSAITGIMREYDLSSFPFEVPGMTHSQNMKLNLEAAGQALVAKGTPIEKLQKRASGKLNLERTEQVLESHGLLNDTVMTYEWDRTAIKKELKEAGIDESKFEALTARAGLSTRKADKEVISALTEDMEVHLKRFGAGRSEDLDSAPEDEYLGAPIA